MILLTVLRRTVFTPVFIVSVKNKVPSNPFFETKKSVPVLKLLEHHHHNQLSTLCSKYEMTSGGRPRVSSESSVKTIGTHDGTFHCDEVLAVYMLKVLPEFKDAQVIRWVVMLLRIVDISSLMSYDENHIGSCNYFALFAGALIMNKGQ